MPVLFRFVPCCSVLPATRTPKKSSRCKRLTEFAERMLLHVVSLAAAARCTLAQHDAGRRIASVTLRRLT